MPNKLQILKRDGVPEFDQHMLTALRGSATLTVPQTIGHGGALGRSVAFAQLVATWANTCAERHVDTKLRADNPDGLERFVSRLHGLTAAYYADRITASDGETNLRRKLLGAAKPRIDAMSKRMFADVARGPMAELVFVHHAHREFHPATYRRKPTNADLMDPQRHGDLVVSPREMNALLRNVLDELNLTLADSEHIKSLLNMENLPLGHLLHEVFRNTAEHAYLDVNHRIPTKGLRCVLIGVRKMQPDALQPSTLASDGHPNIEDYFLELRARAGQGHRSLVHILEISVFDTGPGFSATIDGVVAPDSADVDRVAECFRDHVSSKPGPNSGLGLGRVLAYVKFFGGFVRIRTSTTESFFSSLDGESGQPLRPHVVGNLPRATGTALTVAIPLALYHRRAPANIVRRLPCAVPG